MSRNKVYNKSATQTLGDRAESKNMTVTVEDVPTENPNGEFRMILSDDSKDRDGDQLWADQWENLPERIHMDTDHAWAKGMSVPYTAGSGVPTIDSDGNLIVEGTYAGTEHGQLTRQLVHEKHVWQASVSYSEHEHPDGTVSRELLNGTFTGVPANPNAVVLSSKSMEQVKSNVAKIKDAESKAAAPADQEEHLEHGVAGLDAILDEACKLTCDVDRSTLPEPVGQALDLLVGAKKAAGAIMEHNGIFDPDAPKTKLASVFSGASNKASGGTTDDNYPASQGPFADPKNKKWPLNTAERVRTAWSYIHQSDKTANYNQSEIAAMTGRIRSAARRFNVQLDSDNSKQVLEAAIKTLTAAVVHKDHPSQSTPGNTVANGDVGAVSVYDADSTDEEDDGGDDSVEEGDVGDDELASALHDAACALGFACSKDVASGEVATAYAGVIPRINLGSALQLVTDPKIASTEGDEAVVGSVDLPLSIVTAGPPGQEMYSVYANGKAVAHGELKDLVEATSKDADGRPVGPYQGVEGMSGENASGTTAGESVTGDQQLFLNGTAGAAIPPQFKDQTTNSEQTQESTSTAEPSADAGTAAASKDAAAAPTPADVAAMNATARLRAFNFQNKTYLTGENPNENPDQTEKGVTDHG